MTGLPRTWAAYRGGEILFEVTGPDAEAMVRSAVAQGAAHRVAYRENVRPTRENGWTIWGPWTDDLAAGEDSGDGARQA